MLTACDSATEPYTQYRFQGATMGTQYHVSVVVDRGIDLGVNGSEQVGAAIAQRLNDINRRMSTYIEDSELNQLNNKPSGDWIPLSEELFTVIALAQDVSRVSGGAFDITVGPLVDLWGFGPTPSDESIPSDQDILTLRQAVGFDKLELGSRQIRKSSPTIRIDLSAIAKGYAADSVSELLLAQGFVNHMVEIGGEVKAQGHNSRGMLWRIGIETPAMAHSGVQQAIAIQHVGVATSGDYRNYFEVDGRRYSHTIDPTTGRPITHDLASVTVIASSTAQADAYATALNVLGYPAGKALAEDIDLAAYFIVREGDGFNVDMTEAFKQFRG